jgi:alkyl sulfatase BDS1-like metallo-beta-lactamase superfamily hydrolase
MKRLWLCLGLLGCDEAGEPEARPSDAGVVCVDAAATDARPGDAGPGEPSDAARDAGPRPDAAPAADPIIEAHCRAAVGTPRVEEVAPDLFVALGFDLANVILLRTDDGNVIIDTGMSPTRAREAKAALDAVAPGPVRTIIYTHSHADHVGGAVVFAEEGTEIWATDALVPHLMKQYGAFAGAERFRAGLQFGEHVEEADLPCSAIGRRADVEAALETGVRLPTHTFSGSAMLEVGGITLELHEAPGETHDQLFVWIPALEALLPGDNHYAAFPNLYTIRGTTPRPIDAWIVSLDAMRRRDPAVLVPSHTVPLLDRDEIRRRLTDYRDAIQWLRDAVVRGANAGLDTDTLADTVRLPGHLAGAAGLAELYGQVDWSVRAIYGGQLGWFDGRPERLYPPDQLARREIDLMGGADSVLQRVEGALRENDPRFAAHLLGKLRDAQAVPADRLNPLMAQALRVVAQGIANTNGRAYLLESARGLEQGFDPPGEIRLDETFVDALPVEVVFDVMPSRLNAEAALEAHLRLALVLTDLGTTWHLTVRRGVLEVVAGEPLPDAPPATTLTTTSGTWKRLTLGLIEPAVALREGLLEASDLPATVRFLALFSR